MPQLSAGDLTNARARPIGRRLKVFVFQPTTICTLSVTDADPDTGATELTVNTESGDPSDILAAYTARVTDSAGSLKIAPSKVRVKSYDAGATKITLAENAIDWNTDDLITVVRLFEIWPRIPYINPSTTVQYKDGDIAWASDAQAQPPKANAGPAAIYELQSYADVLGVTLAPIGDTEPPCKPIGNSDYPIGDPADWSDGYADVVLQDEDSFICPSGNDVTSQVWDAIGGSPQVPAGSETGPTVTYRYNATGYHYVKYEVTDGNGQTGHVYVPIVIDDGTKHRLRVRASDRSWDGFGWVLSRRLVGINAVGQDNTWYDGAPVFLVADDGDVPSGAFHDNRSNLRFSGWLVSDDARRGAYEREVSFRVESTAHILRSIPAWPVGLRKESSPSDWYEFSDLSVDSVAYLLLHWHSTALWVADYKPIGDWTDRLRPGENCDADDLLSQVDAVLMAAGLANLRCGRQGVLRAVRNEWLLNDAERAAATTVMTLANTDIQEARYGPHPHQAYFRELRMLGVDGSNNPYIAGAPGSSPLDGGRPMEQDRMAPKTQSELNRWAGRYLALSNWGAAVTVRMAGEYDVFDPARGEFVDGTLSSFDTRIPDGAYSVTGVRFEEREDDLVVISEVELVPDPGTYPYETRSIPTTPTPPAADDPDDDDYEYPDTPEWSVVAIVGTTGGTVTGEITGGAGVCYSSDVTVTTPTWTQLNGGFGGTPIICALAVNPNDEFNDLACIARTDASNTKTQVWVNTDWSNDANWSSALTESAASTAIEAANGSNSVSWVDFNELIAVDNGGSTVLLCAVRYESSGESGHASDNNVYTRVFRSTDWGSTWNVGDRIVGKDYLGSDDTYSYGIHTIDDQNFNTARATGGLAYWGGYLWAAAMAPTRASTLKMCNLAKSADFGASWSYVTQADEQENERIGVGVKSSVAGLYLHAWMVSGSPDKFRVVFSSNGGSSLSRIIEITDTEWSSSDLRLANFRTMLDVSVDGLVAILEVDETGSGSTKLYMAQEGQDIEGDSATQSWGSGYNFRIVKFNPYDGQQLIVGNSFVPNEDAADYEHLLFISDDAGLNWADIGGGSGGTGLWSLGARGISALELIAAD